MRTVALVAAILALPCGLFADEPQAPSLNLTISSPVSSSTVCATAASPAPADVPPLDGTASSKYDTSVYHLKHARARQIIPAVRQALCKSLAAEAEDQTSAPSVVSVAFMPTTSDDALVAICPREHASLVKQAIEDCDVEKQYAVRVQLFEVSPNGAAVPVGEPSVIVGREGSVDCAASGGHASVTLRLKVNDAAPAGDPSKEHAAADSEDETYCSGPDCGRPQEEEASSEKSACPASCTEKPTVELTGSTCNGQCPASCNSQCSTSKSSCQICQGKCGASCKCEGPCSDGCECASSSKCEYAGSAKCPCAGASEKSCESCEHDQSLTAAEYRLLVRILVRHWRQEHEEHGEGVARDEAAPAEMTESCADPDASTTKECPDAPATTAPTTTEKLKVDLGCPGPAPSTSWPATSQTGAPCDQAPTPTVMDTDEEGRLFLHRLNSNDDGFRFGGVYRLGPSDQDDVAVTHVSDADSRDCGSCPSSAGEHCEAQNNCRRDAAGVCMGPSGEPPALLTLSARKDNAPNLAVVISPRWQAELSKIYQGRRLSEIFEPHNAQDPGAAALGRLLAEIPKPNYENDGENGHHRNVIVVDLPDRIRVFESPSEVAPVAAAPCPNCPDQFRQFLAEVFKGSNVLEEIAQAGHTQEETAAEPPRELPSVTQSKLETTVVTYPLRDLVLLDDSERPVFDTCTIIEHIQAAVAPESWWHPSVSIQLDQQSMNLVIRQTPDVHKKIQAHLRDLRRLQVKHLCNLIERFSADSESSDD